MNDLQAELIQLKIQGYCLDYPNNLDLEWLIRHIKQTHDDISDYCEEKNVWDREDNIWALLSAINSTFKLIVRYLEQPAQDDELFENNITVICTHLGNELFCRKSPDLLLFQAAELLSYFIWLLGTPLQKKKFENSSS
jgi:hypothetical protein